MRDDPVHLSPPTVPRPRAALVAHPLVRVGPTMTITKEDAQMLTALAVKHAIRWEFSDGWVTATAVCHAAPDADCRLTSVSCECERWGEIRRDETGVAWHKIVDYGDSTEPLWHELKPMDDCNVCLFINESGCVDELAIKGTSFLIGEHAIKPVWVDDGCDWELAP